MNHSLNNSKSSKNIRLDEDEFEEIKNVRVKNIKPKAEKYKKNKIRKMKNIY